MSLCAKLFFVCGKFFCLFYDCMVFGFRIYISSLFSNVVLIFFLLKGLSSILCGCFCKAWKEKTTKSFIRQFTIFYFVLQ